MAEFPVLGNPRYMKNAKQAHRLYQHFLGYYSLYNSRPLYQVYPD